MRRHRPAQSLAAERQQGQQRCREQCPGDQRPGRSSGDPGIDRPTCFPSPERREQPQAHRVLPLQVAAGGCFVPAQQEKLPGKGQRPGEVAEVGKGMCVMIGAGHRDQHHQRQQGQRRIPCHGPGQASRKPAERETRCGEEGQGDVALQEVTHAPIDLVQAAKPPPDHPPAQQQIRQPALRRVQRLPRPLQQPRAEQARDRQQQRAQAHAVYHRPVAGRRPQVGHKEDSGKQLQQDAEQSHRQALLPHTDPDHRRALECPRCRRPATVKGERDGQRREHRAECKKGFHQQAPVLAPARPHAASEQQVKGAERERAVRRAVRDFLHESHLQTEGDQRHAEDQCGIQVALDGPGRAAGVEDRDDHVHQEEQDQKRLRRRIHLG